MEVLGEANRSAIFVENMPKSTEFNKAIAFILFICLIWPKNAPNHTGQLKTRFQLGGGRLAVSPNTNTVPSEAAAPSAKGNGVGGSQKRKSKKSFLEAADVLERMWEAVRRNNGIMVRLHYHSVFP